MSVHQLASSLLQHIEDHYPDGGCVFAMASSPNPTPILLIAHGESAEELALLERLAEAFSKKGWAAQVVDTQKLTPVLLNSPLLRLMVMTPDASRVVSHPVTSAKTYVMGSPAALIRKPTLRKPLWNALCKLL